MRELKGVTIKELRRCSKAEVEEHGRRLHIYPRDLAVRLKRAGYFLLAISGSPEEILDLFLSYLGFDRYYGTVLARDDEGRYTGAQISTPFDNKRRMLERFLEETGMGLEGSVGVGDTLSDVGFLEMVETPVSTSKLQPYFFEGTVADKGREVSVR